ncbi:MAG TPA: porphobilinogen synthase [Flammeovirgaceae bacterium]|nr:porphobilinogen synthase [Flammeovirgaceae bacterium]
MNRTRRLRNSASLRRLVRETSLSVNDFVYPLFIEEGQDIVQPVTSMPGVHRYSVDRLPEIMDRVVAARVPAVLLFGIPAHKDDTGSETWNEAGIIQQAIRFIKKNYPQVTVITDVCFCEYTSHGHCGVLVDEYVDNDATLSNIQKQVLSHAAAGADMVAPSGMMDGTVAAIREALDANGYASLPVMAYSVKYASSFYGPFREAADSAPSFGDRKTYQMDPANSREGLLEAEYDDLEGADILMVKPAMAYLDVVKSLRDNFNKPIAAYNVSGEYAMIKAAAANGWIDGEKVMMELLLSVKRAGADIIITYFALEAAEILNKTQYE